MIYNVRKDFNHQLGRYFDNACRDLERLAEQCGSKTNQITAKITQENHTVHKRSSSSSSLPSAPAPKAATPVSNEVVSDSPYLCATDRRKLILKLRERERRAQTCNIPPVAKSGRALQLVQKRLAKVEQHKMELYEEEADLLRVQDDLLRVQDDAEQQEDKSFKELQNIRRTVPETVSEQDENADRDST